MYFNNDQPIQFYLKMKDLKNLKKGDPIIQDGFLYLTYDKDDYEEFPLESPRQFDPDRAEHYMHPDLAMQAHKIQFLRVTRAYIKYIKRGIAKFKPLIAEAEKNAAKTSKTKPRPSPPPPPASSDGRKTKTSKAKTSKSTSRKKKKRKKSRKERPSPTAHAGDHIGDRMIGKDGRIWISTDRKRDWTIMGRHRWVPNEDYLEWLRNRNLTQK
tara:strand:+ start:2836 stop:3471 length:636 start_codon:yes stop_codon:yes gene_type:complete